MLLLPLLPALMALFGTVLARPPTCAALFCSEQQHADAWIAGAEDEFVILQQTLFGGFTKSGERTGDCFENSPQLDALVCLQKDTLPKPKCYARYCDFWRHVELFDKNTVGCVPILDGTDSNSTQINRGSDLHYGSNSDRQSNWDNNDRNYNNDHQHNGYQVCRTLRAWAAIGIDKLESALDANEAGNTADATSFACAAEQLLELVNSRLPSMFTKAYADHLVSYVHVSLPASIVSFALDGADPPSLTIGQRTLTTYRHWKSRANDHQAPASNDNVTHTLIATFAFVKVASLSDEEQAAEEAANGRIQILWPVAGVVLPFDKSSLPEQNLCSIATVESLLATSIAPLASLGRRDFAVAVDQFRTCRQFPGQSEFSDVRRYDNLIPGTTCSMIVVTANLVPAAFTSLAYVAHAASQFTLESTPPPANPLIETKLVARVAAADLCTDTLGTAIPAFPELPPPPSNGTNTTSSSSASSLSLQSLGVFGAPLQKQWRQPRPGVPITLAPEESQCIGGDHQGRQCSMESECGNGRTCRALPGSGAAYCYDRFSWNRDEPCALVGDDNECPYGYCYGAADGHFGGAYPLLWVWRQAKCDDPTVAELSKTCNNPDVRQWYLHPTPDSVE